MDHALGTSIFFFQLQRRIEVVFCAVEVGLIPGSFVQNTIGRSQVADGPQSVFKNSFLLGIDQLFAEGDNGFFQVTIHGIADSEVGIQSIQRSRVRPAVVPGLDGSGGYGNALIDFSQGQQYAAVVHLNGHVNKAVAAALLSVHW